MKDFAKKKKEKKVKKSKKRIDALIENILTEISNVNFTNITMAYKENESSLMILMQLLNEGDSLTTKYTIGAIKQCTKEKAIMILILLIENPNLTSNTLKEQVEQSIVEYGRSIVPLLLEVMDNKSLWDPEIVIKILGKIGDNRAVPLIINMLGNDDERIRLIAVEALCKIGNKAAVPSICNALRDKSKNVRIMVAKGLGDFGDIRAINSLQTAVDNLYLDSREKECYKDSIEMIMKSSENRNYRIHQAKNYELAGKYPEAIEIYESFKMWKDAGRLRKLRVTAQKSIKQQYFIGNVDLSKKTGTKIVDSVLHKSHLSVDFGETIPSLACPHCGVLLDCQDSPEFCPQCNMKINQFTQSAIKDQRGQYPLTQNGKEYKFDIAISYASEDREIVEQYAKKLISNNLKVFYDRSNQSFLWGKDLNVILSEIYERNAKYCVIFISKHYIEKWWTERERLAAQIRGMEENYEYLLPVKLDNTKIPGMPPSIVVINFASISMDELVNITLQKLDRD